MHEKIEFELRAFPVLARKAVQRQLIDAQPGTLLGNLSHADHAIPMAFYARQPLTLSPSAISVHDDGDVPRQFLPWNLQNGSRILGSWRIHLLRPNKLALEPSDNHSLESTRDRTTATASLMGTEARRSSRKRVRASAQVNPEDRLPPTVSL